MGMGVELGVGEGVDVKLRGVFVGVGVLRAGVGVGIPMITLQASSRIGVSRMVFRNFTRLPRWIGMEQILRRCFLRHSRRLIRNCIAFERKVARNRKVVENSAAHQKGPGETNYGKSPCTFALLPPSILSIRMS